MSLTKIKMPADPYYFNVVIDRFDTAQSLHRAVRILRRKYKESKDPREKIALEIAIRIVVEEVREYLELGIEEYNIYKAEEDAENNKT